MPELKRRSRRRWLRRLAWSVGAPVTLWLIAQALPLLPHRPLSARYPSSVAVWGTSSAGEARLLRLALAADDTYRVWTPLAQVPKPLVEAVLLHEDQHFRALAVNPVALLRAAYRTYFVGGRRVGGSTLTMQLARRVYGLRSASVGGKLVQLARAVELSLRYSKDEILEAYLNLAPFGGNVEGVGAASLIYFGKPVERLGLPEALTLAVIPQSPARRSPDKASGNRALTDARMALFRRWVARHPEARRDEPLLRLPLALAGRDDLPFRAPHFVDELLADARTTNEHAALRTTLDLDLQRLVERHVRAYVARHAALGLHNAAVLLVDHRTMDVKALVGSADFHDTRIDGQVNGCAARRSPGSALKPFVYALGLEQGVIQPRTLLDDAPAAFGAYSPENFDGRFDGPLSAREALVRSRNIPALEVASKLARPSFYDFLVGAGIPMQPEAHYGLSLVLGTAEVTMEELATLYAALAHGGLLRPLHRLDGDPRPPGVRVLSEQSAFVTLDMLAGNPRPDLGVPDPAGPVCWKTGTSWGFRDAWSVGVVGPYVLAVWVGNFSGEGNPAFVGVRAAAPLFFEIVDSLRRTDARFREFVLTPPSGVERVAVCSVSGQLPGADCPHRVTTWFLPGVSPIDVCTLHRRIPVDDRTGLRACPDTTNPTHDEVYELWPSHQRRLFALAGLPRRAPPAPDPRCPSGDDGAIAHGTPPRILSPTRGVTYALGTLPGQSEALSLRATADGSARELYWFLDDRYLGKATPRAAFFCRPEPGFHVVRVVDDQGRADSRDVKIDQASPRAR